MNKIKRYIPQSINQFIETQSHSFVKWNKDLTSQIVKLEKEALVVACDTIIRVSGSRELNRQRFCEIQATIFKDLLHNDYSLYIDYLADEKIIDVDNNYIAGEKSFGYRINEDFVDDLVSIEIKNPTINKRSLKQVKQSNTKLTVSKKHQQNFLQTFKMDVPSAQHYLVNSFVNKIPDHKNRIYDKYRKLLAEHKLLQIQDGQLWINRSDGNGRIHTNLSNLNGDLKQFILDYDLSMDIVSSQPSMLNILLNLIQKEQSISHSLLLASYDSQIGIFPSADKGLSQQKNRFDSLKKYIKTILKKQGIKNPDTFLTKLFNLQLPNKTELQNWRRLCAGGNLYEYFQKEVNTKLAKKLTRSEIKTILITNLYSSAKNHNEYKKIFSAIFPSIASYITKIKELEKEKRGYRFLAIVLQAIESFIWVENILPSLEKQNTPYHFIHDSIIVKEKDYEKSELLILQEFNYFGFEPKIKIEKL